MFLIKNDCKTPFYQKDFYDKINLTLFYFYVTLWSSSRNGIWWHYWFKDTLKAFSNFINKQKSVWNNVFWYVKICISWNFKKSFFGQKNVTKNSIFFFLRAPTHQVLLLLQFLYELKHKIRLSRTVCEIFHFWFRQ